MRTRKFFCLIPCYFILAVVLILFCDLPDDPGLPKNTKITPLIKTSNDKLSTYNAVDTAGKDLQIGAALFLPDNFDSLRLIITIEDDTLSTTLFKNFRSNTYYDTLWKEFNYAKTGVVTAVFIPYTSLDLPPVNATIHLKAGMKINSRPVIKVSGNPAIHSGEQCSLVIAVSDEDAGQDLKLTMTGNPEGAAISSDSLFTWNAPDDFTGEYTVFFTITDNGIPQLDSTIKIKIIVTEKQSANLTPHWDMDTLPVILTATASYTLQLATICNASEDINFSYSLLQDNLPGDIIIDSIYTFSATAEAAGNHIVTIFVNDEKTGSDTLYLKISIDDAESDTVSPVITLISPLKDSAVVSTAIFTIKLMCSDASPIASVNAQRNDSVIPVLTEGDHYTITISNLTPEEYTPIRIIVTDASTNSNKQTKTISLLYRPTFSITYNGNVNTDGSVPADTLRYTTGMTATVKGNNGDLVKTGATFTGWNTAADGSGKVYNSGDTLQIGSRPVTLYACWKAIPCKISFNGNNNSSGKAPDDIIVDYNTDITIPTQSTLVRTGYMFNGWSTNADGTGSSFGAGSDYSVTGNLSLYAKWSGPAGLVKIAAGGKSFIMGDEGSVYDAQLHTVSFTHDFWIGAKEVTQKEYQALMAATYSGFTVPNWTDKNGAGENYPAYTVNWYDATLFCNARTLATGSKDTIYTYTSIANTPGNDCVLEGFAIDLTKKGFRLPTEAEWEFSYRAGTTTDYYWNKDYNPYPENLADSNEINNYAVWNWNSYDRGEGNAGYGTHPVGQTIKNGFNLYDMAGNVAEWCNDWYGKDYYTVSPSSDPTGPASGDERVLRGGNWAFYFGGPSYLTAYCRTGAGQKGNSSAYGFRICLPE